MKRISTPASPHHFRGGPSLKRKILLFFAGALLFSLIGALWYGLFSLLGLTRGSAGRDLSLLSDYDLETTFIEDLAAVTRRLAKAKPCFVRRAKKLIRVIKHGCPHKKRKPRPSHHVNNDEEDVDGMSDREMEKRLSMASKLVDSKRRSAAHIAKQHQRPRDDEVDEEDDKGVVPQLSHDAAPPWWSGPPLLDPWRNVGSKRMRSGWKYEKRSNEGTIFVSLVSFRDRRCPDTLLDLFEKARHPDLINVGVVQQNIRSDKDCFRDYCRRAGSKCRPESVRIIRMPADKSRGVMVVRHLASTLFQGEQYFLQLDAHNKFSQDWDVALITDLAKVKSERVVLSHHPPAISSMANWGRQAINICKYEWDGNGLPRFAANVVTPPANKPFPGVFIGAGMVFARSEILIDCPFDKHLPFLFSGEELLLAACAFSHGWDIYNPTATPVFHFYKGGANGDKSINPVNDRIHAKSLKRLKYALGVEGSFQSLPKGEFRQDFHLYAMGSARRLDEYYEYAGIDWVKKDKKHPFCATHQQSYYKFHNTPVQGLPSLASLSYDKGVSQPDPAFRIKTGKDLTKEM